MNTHSHDRIKRPSTTRLVFLGVFGLLLSTLASRSRADDLDTWLKSENAVAITRLFNNLLQNGAVIASPANRVFNDPCHPDYYYHWVRDGSLAMDVLVSLSANSPDPSIRARASSQLMSYIDFSLNIQQTNNLSSVFNRGIGEPKFNTNGSPIQCGWGRPQNDGPGLRAASLCRLANRWLDSGQSNLVTLVKTKLYDGVLPTNSLIKRDLEYVSHYWSDSCIDLWEESYGHHFYTRMVQRRALRDGAVLARRLGDGAAADYYTSQAAALENAIQGHWDASRGLLIGTLDMEGPKDSNNRNYKTSGLDAAVVLGVLHANTPGDDFFSPTDDKVLATAQKLAASFGFYNINRTTTHDAQGKLLGTAIGRYPEDRYFSGNPWFLCTAAMAELYFRAADSWETRGSLAVSDLNRAFFQSLDSSRFSSLQSGQTLTRNDPAFDDVLSALRAAGDAQLRRVKEHTNADGSLSEQFSKDNGFEMSFADLSWSYASVITATAVRAPSGQAPGDLKPFRPARPVDHGDSFGEPFIPDFAKPSNRLGLPLDEIKRRFPQVIRSTPKDVDQPTPDTLPSGRSDYRRGGPPADDRTETKSKSRQPTLDDLNKRLLRLEQSVNNLSREIQAERSSKQESSPGGKVRPKLKGNSGVVSPIKPVVMEALPARLRGKVNQHFNRHMALSASSFRGQAPSFVLNKLKLHLPGDTIRVAFKGGDPDLHSRIEQATRDWTDQGNIKLDFGFDEATGKYREWTINDQDFQAEVRISFDQPGYWSLVGNDSRNLSIVRPNEASMNFQDFESELPDDFKGVVLHEFGHALGFEHEHQHPTEGCDAEFRWEDDPGYQDNRDNSGQYIADSAGRRPGIYTVLGGPPNNWSRYEVDFNLKQLQVEAPDSHAFISNIQFSHFDKLSIMKYYFPDWMFTNGDQSACFSPGETLSLSNEDIQGITQAYPPSGPQADRVVLEKKRDLDSVLNAPGLKQEDRVHLQGLRNAVR